MLVLPLCADMALRVQSLSVTGCPILLTLLLGQTSWLLTRAL
jgi:hypothetical protein